MSTKTKKRSNKMSWFNTGFKHAEAKERTENKEPHSGVPSRFWVPKNGSGTIIFLDNFDWRFEHGGYQLPVVPFTVYEHCVIVDNDFKNRHFYTCHGHDCPLCEAKYASRQVFAFTVLNLWKNKENKDQASKQLFVCNKATAMLLESRLAKKGNLHGLKYSVGRAGDKSPTVGNDFEFEESVGDNIKTLYPNVDIAPYYATAEVALDYYKGLFQPKPAEEIRAFLKQYDCTDGYTFNPNRTSKPRSSTPEGSSGESIEY